MKKAIILLYAAIIFAPATAHSAMLVDSNGIPFGDGFPSGHYYTLNIIIRQSGFACPQPEYIDGVQVHGNGLITILMESGDKGTKGPQDTATREVTEWCTESFPGRDSGKRDAAILRLPQNAKGYAVYARVAGHPGEYGDPTVTIVPDLLYVEDEAENDLVLLGLIDLSGTPMVPPDMTTESTGISAQGKGAEKIIDLIII